MLSRVTAAPIGLMFLLTGCATSTANYTPPVATTTQNSKQVKQSFDSVWDQLIKQLSSDFFVINNIDKNSRLINLSFTAQQPSQYVDCGISSRKFTNARGEQNYVYKTADSAAFATTNKEGMVFSVRRNARLEGRTNIYIAPEGPGTLVTVNTKYVVTTNVSAVRVDGQSIGNENLTYDFSTKQGYTSAQVSCYSLGLIERRILDLVKD